MQIHNAQWGESGGQRAEKIFFKFLLSYIKYDFYFTFPIKNLQVKPRTSDWDLNPCAGTQTQPKPRLGLEPTWPGLEPSQNTWSSN